jgi:exonuclease VII large subunit
MARDAELAARELVHSSKRRLDAARTALDGAGASVTARDPARMLALGWATARGPDGRLLRSVRDTTVGAPVIVGLRDGSITSRVEEIESRGDPVAEEGRIVRGADG